MPASTRRAREARRSSSRARSSASRRSFSSASAAALPTASTSSESSVSDASWMIAAIRAPSRSTGVTERPEPIGGSSTSWPAEST